MIVSPTVPRQVLSLEWVDANFASNPLYHLLQIGAQLAIVCPSGDNWRAGCANPILTLISGLHLDGHGEATHEVIELRMLLRLLCNKGSTIKYRWLKIPDCFSLEFPWFLWFPHTKCNPITETHGWSVSHPNRPFTILEQAALFLAFLLRLSFKERLGSPCCWCRASLQ